MEVKELLRAHEAAKDLTRESDMSVGARETAKRDFFTIPT